MLTDPKLRSQVDALWDKFWTGGLSNPLDKYKYGADAVERWFTGKEVTDIVVFINRLSVSVRNS